MKLKCISKEELQDKNDPKVFYHFGDVKEFAKDRAEELLKSGLFEEVKQNKKDIKEDTK